MNLQKLKLTKKKIIATLIPILIYLTLIISLNSTKCRALVICGEKPHHNVPSLFPYSKCGQICASQAELIQGYIIFIFLYVILPIILIYVIVSFLSKSGK